jgi:predicted small lipoprotein YifL
MKIRNLCALLLALMLLALAGCGQKEQPTQPENPDVPQEEETVPVRLVCSNGSTTLRFSREEDGHWLWADDKTFPLDESYALTLTPAEGAWTADGRDVTDQLADLTAWLGDMHLAACVDWRPSAGAAALCGLDQPGAVLTAEYTHNGVQHSFTLTVGGQRGAGYCVTVSDDDTIYLMSAEALAPLLALAQTGLA